MKIRNLNSDHDFTFGKGAQSYLNGEDAIGEDIDTYIKLWVGNCFFALQAGINWRQYLDKGQKAKLLGALQQGILSRFGVMGINQILPILDPFTRRLTVTYDVQTIYTQSFKNSVTIGAHSA